MELKDAHVHYFQEHGLLQYHLVFHSMKDGVQGMIRYIRIASALGLKLIQVTSATGAMTTKELNANCNEYHDNVMLVGFISGCTDAKQITFNLPSLKSAWNIYRGERAIVDNNNLLTLMDWGRAKGARARVMTTQLVASQAEHMLSQGKWFVQSFAGTGTISMTIMNRSFKEQIGMQALMLLTTPLVDE